VHVFYRSLGPARGSRGAMWLLYLKPKPGATAPGALPIASMHDSDSTGPAAETGALAPSHWWQSASRRAPCRAYAPKHR